MTEYAWFGLPATATAEARPKPAEDTFGFGNLGAEAVPAPPLVLDELPAPVVDASDVAATGATGSDPTDDVAVGVGGVGITNPELVVGVVLVTVVLVGVVTVPTLPEPSMVTPTVAVTLAASAVITLQTSAIPLTELAATKLTIWCRDIATCKPHIFKSLLL